MTQNPTLDDLAAQESALVFDRFDDDTAWAVGVALRAAARAASLPVAISIRRNGQRLFHAALPGATADNDGWLERKSAVVDRYGHSSLYIGEEFRAAGKTFEDSSRLDPSRYAAHGGAFPVIVRGVGCVGTIAVSGLPQREDHRLVVETLEAFLRRDNA
ncbi:heme-degrading domain-containing protein [Terrabacter sp. 2YAF2]|uniref:heme-degrading domain-containing protein n=1 Tax=Terrabacter sp. 2YAF2 TaxID=3233026 RepID=UPI003F9C1892